MSLKFSAAHSSRIEKQRNPASFKRNSSSPFSSLPRRKAIPRAPSRPETADEDEELFGDRLDDVGMVSALAADLTLRDVAQAVLYVRGRMWSPIPEHRSGMNSTKISEVLNFRSRLPPIVTVTLVQALLNSPTTVEREIAQLIKGGAMRKVVIEGRGSLGEVLIMVRDLDDMIRKSGVKEATRERFVEILRASPTALKVARGQLPEEDAKALMQAGFLTSSTPSWTSTEVFSRPAGGSRGTMTSLDRVSRAASGSLAAVGGEGAVYAAGGSGGGSRGPGAGEYTLALPTTGSFLKLVVSARAHLLSLLSRCKYQEAPESLLRQRWDGGLATATYNRGECTALLPGQTRKWRQFRGMSFDWILGECVGAGLVEVFDTRSIGRGVRAL
ncbi:hypothetical protein JHW43_005095 [Diplocarpon mali]|nr:hypothetical protein JHW43_005095 [Diplocarpon mali]